MPTPVLATKLFPPTPRSALVARPRLAERLDSTLHPGHRLTLVSAPAGFGKSTLLSDWAARHERVAWLSLDEGDNALPRFMAHLGATLAGVGLDVNPDALAAAPSDAALTAIVNELANARRQRPDSHWLLVLDDYHVIEAPEIHEAMTFLLEHMPDQMHLLVATRSDPPFPLSRLRTRDQLTEVRAADLRFVPAEAREFLNVVMGLHLTDDDVQALDERTEGWIAGLQLAALSLRGMSEHDEVADFIGAFTGSHRFVIDYLVDEVLARKGDDVRDFLLHTAVLDRLTGSLCDAVTGRTDGDRMLADLDRGNVFLVALDAERSWYRYHHLFGDVLRARLLAERTEQVPTLHQAASDWFAAHGLVVEAVHHALAAGDHDRAAFLMEWALPEQRRARQDSVLLGWVRSLPEQVIRRSPVLSLMSAWSLMMAGDLNAMERRLDDADDALAAGAADPALAATWPDTQDLRTAPAMVSVYRAALAQARGDVPATMGHARRALDLAGADDHLVRGSAGGYVGLAAWAAGDVVEALATFSDAARNLHEAGNLTDALDMTIVLGDMWLTAGRPSRARRLYEQALRTATRHGEPYPRATADLHVGLAELDRELGDLAGAAAHMETARVLAERSSITENRYRWYVASAQLLVATGDHAGAVQMLDQAEELYRPGFYPQVRPIGALRARVQIAAGDLAAAEEWAHDRGLSAADEVTFLREYDHLTLVRLLLARHSPTPGPSDPGVGSHRGDDGPAEANAEHHPASAGPADAGPNESAPLGDVLALMQRLHDAAESRAGSLLEIGMLRALTLDALGERTKALTELQQALVHAPEPDAYVRLFLDEGAPMLALLHDAASIGQAGEPSQLSPSEESRSRSGVERQPDVLRRYARRLLAAAASARDSAAAAAADVALAGDRDAAVTGAVDAPPVAAGNAKLAEPLSARELEVLRLLDTELTGPEISEKIFVSLNTFRTHSKRIFTKLDVKTRSAAVRRARDLGLL